MKQVRLEQVGESLGIVLPADVVARLDVRDGDVLEVVETTGGVELRSRKGAEHEQARIADEIIEQNDEALRRLAR